jgi:hypothetical protein
MIDSRFTGPPQLKKDIAQVYSRRSAVMDQTPVATIGTSYRFAGWTGASSGAIGVIAFGFLVAALAGRVSSGDEQSWEHLIRVHDVGVILQSILMIPVVFALYNLGRQRSEKVSRTAAALGLVALSLIIALLALTVAKAIWDVLYMIPQGLLGFWLIAVNRSTSPKSPRSLRILGTVSGVGLVLVAAFPIGYAIFVDPLGLHGPVPFDYVPPQAVIANATVHIVLVVGTFMGVATYPIWAALLGRKLLHMS